MGLEAITLWLRVQKLAKPAFDGLLDTVSNRILSLALELREQLSTVDDKTEKLEPAGVDDCLPHLRWQRCHRREWWQ